MLIILIIGTVITMLLNAFFSGSETVLTSANKLLLKGKAEKGDKKAKDTLDFISDTRKFLGVTLLGTNLMVVATTTMVKAIMEGRVPGEYHLWINAFLLTPVILIMAELTPKSLGRLKADTLVIPVHTPLAWCGRIMHIPIVVLSFLSRKFASLLGVDAEAVHGKVTRDDLKAVTEMAAEQGLVGEEVSSILKSVLELDSRPLSSVMIPLVNVVSISERARITDVEELAAEKGFTRFPVYRDRVDEFVGVIDVRKLYFHNEYCDNYLKDEEFITNFVERDNIYFPETKPVNELLNEFRYYKLRVAFAIDEHGGVVGMVTMEDLLEEFIGEIHDERDEDKNNLYHETAAGIECKGNFEITELEEILEIEIEHDGFETAAGLVMKLAGNVPDEGATYEYEGYVITVLEMDNRRIVRILFSKADDSLAAF